MEKIKNLREKTGAGMVDCKKALDESNGDIDKAVEILRKKGIVKAAKREARVASEGLILVSTNEQASVGYILEVNSETDFVSRNEKFQEFVKKIMDLIVEKKPASKEELDNLSMEQGTVQENLDNLSGTIGEKLNIKKFDIITTTGTIAAYSHMGGRIGVLAVIDKTDSKELAYEIAMQIAAANPKYIKPEEVSQEELDKEKEIYKEQLLKEGKPENIIDKIIEGKIAKYYEEVCLIKQEYIKEDKKKVEEILCDAKVERFIRYSL